MALSDVIKKGTGVPPVGSLIVGGIGIDTTNKKLYIKNADNTVTEPNLDSLALKRDIATSYSSAEVDTIAATKEPADATILKSASIGTTVQGHSIALDAVTGTNTGDQTASTVPNTPVGNIAATNVQAAINELDTEKVAQTQIGTGANQIVQLDATAKLPAVDGSQLTNIGLGVGQTWQDMIASRVVGTTYTNSTGKSISLAIVLVNGASTDYMTLYVDGIYVATANGALGDSQAYSSFMTVVPNNSTYLLDISAGSSFLTSWKELR